MVDRKSSSSSSQSYSQVSPQQFVPCQPSISPAQTRYNQNMPVGITNEQIMQSLDGISLKTIKGEIRQEYIPINRIETDYREEIQYEYVPRQVKVTNYCQVEQQQQPLRQSLQPVQQIQVQPSWMQSFQTIQYPSMQVESQFVQTLPQVTRQMIRQPSTSYIPQQTFNTFPMGPPALSAMGPIVVPQGQMIRRTILPFGTLPTYETQFMGNPFQNFQNISLANSHMLLL